MKIYVIRAFLKYDTSPTNVRAHILDLDFRSRLQVDEISNIFRKIAAR